MKRTLALLATIVALAGSTTVATGCGAGAHFLGGVAAHHVINQFARSPTARRRVNKLFCLYHGHRVLVDVRHHHLFLAGLNAISAYHACRAGFGRR